MPTFQAPPTWAEVVLTDPRSGKPKFNPVWLKWFLDVAQVLGTSGGGSGTIQHNSTGGLQGGGPNQFFHLDLAKYSILSVADAGVWTPTLTNVTNISSSTAYQSQYLRVGGQVAFSCKVTVTPTGTGSRELGVSLPIPSNFTAQEQCAGSGASAVYPVMCQADATNDRISVVWSSTDTASRDIYLSGIYRIL